MFGGAGARLVTACQGNPTCRAILGVAETISTANDIAQCSGGNAAACLEVLLPVGARIVPDSGGRLLWGRWNDYPKGIVGGREYAQIGTCRYTHPAVDRMQPSGLGPPAGTDGPGRNVTPSNVEEVIANGTSTTTPVGGVERTEYISGNVSVVTEGRGTIVVTILRNRSQ